MTFKDQMMIIQRLRLINDKKGLEGSQTSLFCTSTNIPSKMSLGINKTLHFDRGHC